jgi:hypothetical protein
MLGLHGRPISIGNLPTNSPAAGVTAASLTPAKTLRELMQEMAPASVNRTQSLWPWQQSVEEKAI